MGFEIFNRIQNQNHSKRNLCLIIVIKQKHPIRIIGLSSLIFDSSSWFIITYYYKMGNQATICCHDINPDENVDKIIVEVVKNQEIHHPQTTPSTPDHRYEEKSQTYLPSSPIKNLTSEKYQKPVQKLPTIPTVPIPELSQNVRKNLEKLKPFADKLDNNLPAKKFDDIVYQGQLDESDRPHGYGKMFYPSGALLIGHFDHGMANGPQHYVWPNGSYYTGLMKNNKGNDENGTYCCGNFMYIGSINNNQMHGHGTEEGEGYKFIGIYQRNKRKSGKLIWTQKQTKRIPITDEQIEYDAQYIYEGNFDENQNFTGSGILTCPKGTYRGSFKNGMKDGQGIFNYQNKLRYEGTYKKDVKEGKGTIYTKDNSVAYCGEMKNGLPHGKGWVPGPDGKQNHLQWNYGISNVIIHDSQMRKTIQRISE